MVKEYCYWELQYMLYPNICQFMQIMKITLNIEAKRYRPLVRTSRQTSGRTEHHEKLHVLISAEIREHKLAGQTLLLT